MGEISPPTTADYAMHQANLGADRLDALEGQVAKTDKDFDTLQKQVLDLCFAVERLLSIVEGQQAALEALNQRTSTFNLIR
jgi:uncharacterized coiled-coil protein SlyX